MSEERLHREDFHPAGQDPEAAWPDLSELPAVIERQSESALLEERPPEHHDLLRFYDKLRGKILHGVERRGGRLSEAAVEALLLVPDVFILLVRLALDHEVPGKARAVIAGTLAYFILPTDLFPEAVFGAAGYLDDLVLAAAVLSQVFGGELEKHARRHWSGAKELHDVLRDITATAHALLGVKLHQRLQRLLARRGIKLDR